MKKIKRGFIELVAVLALGSSGMAFAAPCVNIVAVWDMICESAFLEPGGGAGFTGPSTGILNINMTSPDGCFFLGEVAVASDPPTGLTGAQDGSAIRITTADTVADGRLIGRNRMELTVSVLVVPTGTRVVNTSLCTATRP